ncbi:hypothetical protein, partial [Arcticibacter tournemirensis]
MSGLLSLPYHKLSRHHLHCGSNSAILYSVLPSSPCHNRNLRPFSLLGSNQIRQLSFYLLFPCISALSLIPIYHHHPAITDPAAFFIAAALNS